MAKGSVPRGNEKEDRFYLLVFSDKSPHARGTGVRIEEHMNWNKRELGSFERSGIS